MEEWRSLGDTLEAHLRPVTFPVAVRFLQEDEAPPSESRTPLEDVGCPVALCQAFTMSRTRGWTVALGAEDSSCTVANYGMGWRGKYEREWMTGFLQVMNYSRDEQAAESRLSGLATLEPGRFHMIVSSPLLRTRVEPHVVLVYGNAAQLMRLVQAASRWTGGGVKGAFGGIAGSCNEGAIRTFVEDRPRLALPGNGDRVFAATQDEELIFAFPAGWSRQIVEGLEATGARGIRYPIPSFMQYELPFADLLTRFSGDDTRAQQ